MREIQKSSVLIWYKCYCENVFRIQGEQWGKMQWTFQGVKNCLLGETSPTELQRVSQSMTDTQEGNIHERKREPCHTLSGTTSLVHAPSPRDFELYAENDVQRVHFRKIVLNPMQGGQCEAWRIARRQMCGSH